MHAVSREIKNARGLELDRLLNCSNCRESHKHIRDFAGERRGAILESLRLIASAIDNQRGDSSTEYDAQREKYKLRRRRYRAKLVGKPAPEKDEHVPDRLDNSYNWVDPSEIHSFGGHGDLYNSFCR